MSWLPVDLIESLIVKKKKKKIPNKRIEIEGERDERICRKIKLFIFNLNSALKTKVVVSIWI